VLVLRSFWESKLKISGVRGLEKGYGKIPVARKTYDKPEKVFEVARVFNNHGCNTVEKFKLASSRHHDFHLLNGESVSKSQIIGGPVHE